MDRRGEENEQGKFTHKKTKTRGGGKTRAETQNNVSFDIERSKESLHHLA